MRLNLAAGLLDSTRGSPEKTAFVFRDSTVSYAALRRQMLSVAAGLADAGVRPGDPVALNLPNGPDYVAAWMAVQWLGAIGVQLPPIYRRREIERVVSDSGASVIVSADTVESLRTPRSTDREPSPHPAADGDPAILTYITAADGPLRGVVHTAADMFATCDAYAGGVLKMRSDDVCIGALGLGWAYGLGALLVFPLHAGATSVILDAPDQLLLSVAHNSATILFAVPTTYRMLLRQPNVNAGALRSLRCCVSAGEPLPPDVAEEWRRRTGHDIVDGLGTTELAHIVISARPGHVRPGFIGQPVDRYDARVIDADGREVPDGNPGRLAVRGPTRARYWHDPDAERRAILDGWTLTGDICIRHDDGWFQHLRRADALIVSAGYKISIREVEDVLVAHPDVSRARVESAPDPMRGAVAQAFVVPVHGADTVTLAERLRLYVKSELAPYKCPRVIGLE